MNISVLLLYAFLNHPYLVSPGYPRVQICLGFRSSRALIVSNKSAGTGSVLCIVATVD